jgi:hypothetical protein
MFSLVKSHINFALQCLTWINVHVSAATKLLGGLIEQRKMESNDKYRVSDPLMINVKGLWKENAI